MLQEFKAFVLRGNLLDLAVAFILGLAFSVVISTFTNGVLMALIAAVFGEPNFDAITWTVGDGVVEIGAFLTAVVNFLLVAAVLFFVLKAAKAAQRTIAEPAEDAPAPSDEARLLTEIRDLLRQRSS